MAELNIKLKQYMLHTMKNFLMAIRASNFSCSGVTRLSPGWTWHMWLVPMGSWVIWLIQLFEMYKPQVDFFSGWEVLKKLVALSSGLCFILLHGVKSVNNVIAFWTINLFTLWTAGSVTLKPLQALFDSSRLFNTSLNTKSKIHYPAQDVERIIQRQYKNI